MDQHSFFADPDTAVSLKADPDPQPGQGGRKDHPLLCQPPAENKGKAIDDISTVKHYIPSEKNGGLQKTEVST